MSIWRKQPEVEAMQAVTRNTLVETLGIEFLEVGEDYLKARMPVEPRTHQPFGMLHGGASVVLSETLGSVASQHCCEEGMVALGLNIEANHIRSIKSGWVYGTVRPVHVGRTTQVWETLIENEEGKPICKSKLTAIVVKLPD